MIFCIFFWIPRVFFLKFLVETSFRREYDIKNELEFTQSSRRLFFLEQLHV